MRELLRDCLARNLIAPAAIMARFDVGRPAVSRFKGGDKFPSRKLAPLKAFLEDVASGRVVLAQTRLQRLRAQSAKRDAALAEEREALVASLPEDVRSHIVPLQALASNADIVRRVEHALVAFAVVRTRANLTLAEALLNVSRRVVARTWGQIESSLGTASDLDARDEEERARRTQRASDFVKGLEPAVRDFARALVDSPNTGTRPKFAIAMQILSSPAAGRAEAGARRELAGKGRSRPSVPDAIVKSNDGPPSVVPSLRSAIELLAQKFAEGVLTALRDAKLEELLTTADEKPARRPKHRASTSARRRAPR